MSNKINRFNNNIIPLWDQVQNVVNEIDKSRIPDEYIENFAYLKKIATFLSEAMSCIDADFLPNDSINTIESYLTDIETYLVNTGNYTNLSYISYVEARLDNLLQIIFPFILHKGKAIKGLRVGLNEYSKTVTDHVVNGFSEIELTKKNAKEIQVELENELDNFRNLKAEIEEYRNLIFSADGVKEKIEDLLHNSELKLSEIEGLHNSIYDEDGLKQEIDEFYSNISDTNNDINELKKDSLATLQGLEQFYDKIFGKDDENGNKIGGLKQEIEQRKKDLEEFKKN